jgi:hypothetical protein
MAERDFQVSHRPVIRPQSREFDMTAKNHRAAPEAAGKKAMAAAGEDKRGKVARIRDLNDRFRRTLRGGTVVMTRGVEALGVTNIRRVFVRVKSFEAFSPDNDPWGEHDFGAFELDGDRFFWKIDSYDPTMSMGSADPTDPDLTRRVLTVMLSEEY